MNVACRSKGGSMCMFKARVVIDGRTEVEPAVEMCVEEW